MKEIVRFLEENTSGALATVEGGRPRVRPWGFMLEEEGRLYFCTANTKQVFRQLKEKPYVEFASTSKEMVTVRISGEITFSADKEIKKKILKRNDLVRSIYKSEENPVFEVFYIEHGEAIMSDFSGQPPKKLIF